MMCSIITEPPPGAEKYSAAPETDTAEKYVDNLVALLKQRAFNIVAEGVPMDRIVEADKKWPITGYRVVMQRIPVNGGGQLSTAFGNFWFELKPSD